MKPQYGEPNASTAASRLRARCCRLGRGCRVLGTAVLSCWLLLGASACTKTPDKPPASALKQAKKDSRLDHQEVQDLERRHLAPPPAYGNKVVMAQDERANTHHF